MDVQEIYFTLAAYAESATFEATVKVLDDYFVPKANVPFERHLFRQIVQESEETVDQFVCRLRQRAINCEFGENENDYIRDQVIDRCYSSKLRRKFLEKEGALTLDDLLRIARSQEAVDRQLKQYGTDQVNNQLSDQVNAVGDKSDGNTRSGKGKKCFSCDQEGHFSGDRKCPARDCACRMCGVIGHLKVKCPRARQRGGGGSSSRGDKGGRGDDGGRRNTGRRRGDGGGRRGRGRGRPQETNLVADGNHSGEATRPVQHSPEFAFTVEQLTGHERKSNDLITLKGINCESRKSARELFAYGGTEPLPTLGTFTADVSLTGNKGGCRADFVVVKGDGRTLLGRETAEILNLLHIGPFQANNVVSGGLESCIREKYKALFTGVGLLKGNELKLHIDESVKPVAQPVRRIPFGLREKVDKKLDQLLELDIIEEVPDGPSRWISPLVVVPKGDGDIRVCVDMRRANEAIIRERHPIPTVEELLHDLNGSTPCSVRLISNGVFIRFCSARTVDTSLLLSRTEVFIVIGD